MTTMDFPAFIEHILNCLPQGSIYALMAIGFTLVYGILRFVNIPQGDLFMLVVFFAFYGLAAFSLPCFLTLPQFDLFSHVFVLRGISIPVISIGIPLVTVLLLIIVFNVIYRTKVGMAVRAASTDCEAARLMGIRIPVLILVTFGIGGILVSVSAILWGVKHPQTIPLMGLLPGLKGFVAAMIGGMGNLFGAVIGGFILGISEVMLVGFYPTTAQYSDLLAFIFLILVLLIRPQGILGKVSVGKV